MSLSPNGDSVLVKFGETIKGDTNTFFQKVKHLIRMDLLQKQTISNFIWPIME